MDLICLSTCNVIMEGGQPGGCQEKSSSHFFRYGVAATQISGSPDHQQNKNTTLHAEGILDLEGREGKNNENKGWRLQLQLHPSIKACHVAISRRGTVAGHFAPSRGLHVILRPQDRVHNYSANLVKGVQKPISLPILEKKPPSVNPLSLPLHSPRRQRSKPIIAVSTPQFNKQEGLEENTVYVMDRLVPRLHVHV